MPVALLFMAAKLLCRLRWHKWQKIRTNDGAQYRQCVRCGRQGDIPGAPGAWGAPGGPVGFGGAG